MEKEKIRELLQFDYVIEGDLIAYSEPGIDGIIFCINKQILENDSKDKIEKITSYERLVPIICGDHLVVYDEDRITVEREIDIDFSKGLIEISFSSKGITPQEFYSWFISGHERKAKIIRRKN